MGNAESSRSHPMQTESHCNIEESRCNIENRSATSVRKLALQGGGRLPWVREAKPRWSGGGRAERTVSPDPHPASRFARRRPPPFRGRYPALVARYSRNFHMRFPFLSKGGMTELVARHEGQRWDEETRTCPGWKQTGSAFITRLREKGRRLFSCTRWAAHSTAGTGFFLR